MIVASLVTLFAAVLQMNYKTPASVWNEALPLGNGRIGVMVFGAPAMERLELNEETYWAGGPHDSGVKGMKPLIDEARRRILAGDAGALMRPLPRILAWVFHGTVPRCPISRWRHFA